MQGCLEVKLPPTRKNPYDLSRPRRWDTPQKDPWSYLSRLPQKIGVRQTTSPYHTAGTHMDRDTDGTPVRLTCCNHQTDNAARPNAPFKFSIEPENTLLRTKCLSSGLTRSVLIKMTHKMCRNTCKQCTRSTLRPSTRLGCSPVAFKAQSSWSLYLCFCKLFQWLTLKTTRDL